MKRTIAIAALLALTSISASRGEGALAVAIPDEGLHKGFAYGWNLRAKTPDEARKEALVACRDQAKNNGVQPGKCKVVEVFKKSCVAISLDSKQQWAGWGVGADEKTARARAIRQCKVGGVSCSVADLDCDK